MDAIALEVVEMGGLAEAQLAASLAVLERPAHEALAVAAKDAALDRAQAAIDAAVLAALTTPAATAGPATAERLRFLLGALKIAGDLERVGDLAANIAKRASALGPLPEALPRVGLAALGVRTRDLLRRAIDAFAALDPDQAAEVRLADQPLDALHASLFQAIITPMAARAELVGPGAHLLFVAKNLERIGDHATNIAEVVTFIVAGAAPAERRPTQDSASLLPPRPPEGGPAP